MSPAKFFVSIVATGAHRRLFKGGEETSKALPEAYRRVAEACGCHFLDASQIIETSEVDGVHLDPPAHRTLALEVKKVVEPSLFTP